MPTIEVNAYYYIRHIDENLEEVNSGDFDTIGEVRDFISGHIKAVRLNESITITLLPRNLPKDG